MGVKRIGVLTGGGDCPGLNPAVKWVAKTFIEEGPQVYPGERLEAWGVRDGWKGLVEEPLSDPAAFARQLVALDPLSVRTIDRSGGTILGTSRTNPFDRKDDRSALAVENLKRLAPEGLVAIGGEDTLSVAKRLADMGLPVVGIPKTIDKDLSGTDYSLGFESAVEVITHAIDDLRSTAGSHSRIFVVETMGREAGHLALHGGLAGNVSVILIPEHDFDLDRVNGIISERRKHGARYTIVVVAEGAKPRGGRQVVRDARADAFGHQTLGGIGNWLADEIARTTGLETRSMVLSHLQRGGRPCAFDRRIGRSFGIAAVELVFKKQFGRMVSLKEGRITSVPLSDAVGKLSLVDVVKEYDTKRLNGIRISDLPVRA